MSNMQKYCPKGHAYDSSLPSCPFCLPNQGGNLSPTAPANQYGGNLSPTAPANQYGGNLSPTAPVNQYGSNQGGSVEPTVPVQQKTVFIGDLSVTSNSTSTQQATQARVRPVVGWLVCVQGPDIGKDFRLHTHFNHVGRNEDQDVCLSDPTVSGEHFTVSYDMQHNHYFADMNKGSTFVYINSYPLGGRTVLKKGDQIKVGNSLLVFIPLEQQDVKWNWKI